MPIYITTYIFNKFPHAHSARGCCPLCPPPHPLSLWTAMGGPMVLWSGGRAWNASETGRSEMSIYITIYLLHSFRHAHSARRCCPPWAPPHPLSLWPAMVGPRVHWSGQNECNCSVTACSELPIYIAFESFNNYAHAHSAHGGCPLWSPPHPLSHIQPWPSKPCSRNGPFGCAIGSNIWRCISVYMRHIFMKKNWVVRVGSPFNPRPLGTPLT